MRPEIEATVRPKSTAARTVKKPINIGLSFLFELLLFVFIDFYKKGSSGEGVITSHQSPKPTLSASLPVPRPDRYSQAPKVGIRLPES